MSDEAPCPTCHKPKSFADDLVKTLEDKGAIDKIATLVSNKVSGGNNADLTQTIRDALANYQPNVRVVHHGIEDLKACKTCSPELNKVITIAVANDRLKRLEQRKVAQVSGR